MIRALLPVALALILAVAAGVLLAQNGVFGGASTGAIRSSAAPCCSKSPASELPASFANVKGVPDADACGFCSRATIGSSPNTQSGEKTCSGGGCPFTAASLEAKGASDRDKCCFSEATACGSECNIDCEPGARQPCEETDKACCSGDEKCCFQETDGSPSNPGDEEVASAAVEAAPD